MTTEYWAILIPLIINVLTVAFLFGGLIQRIRALETDLAKLQIELEKIKDAHARSDANLHRVEVVLSRIEARFDMFLGVAVAFDTTKWPIAKEASAKMVHKP